MGMIGHRVDPLISCNFRVTFEGLATDFLLTGNDPDNVGFAKVSGLDREITVREVLQGSDPVVVELPDKIKNGPVTFERGMSNSDSGLALHQWFVDTTELMRTVADADSVKRAGKRYGSTRPTIRRRNVTIEVPAQARTPTSSNLPGVVVTLVGAWPTKFSLGPLDANTGSVWIHSIEMRHSGIRIAAI
jgi:phage tail-like protein